MHSLYNNRILGGIFGTLLVVFLLVRFTSGGREASNFRTQLVTLDTAQVNMLTLEPPGAGEVITFRRVDSSWQVQQGGVTAPADQQAVAGLLATLTNLKPQRLAARSSEKWNTFEVTDSLGTQVSVRGDDQTLAELLIGKFSLQATPALPPQPGMPPMQQPQPKATSYVRLVGEDEVYAVDGFLSSLFDRPFNGWRDAEFLAVEPAELTQVTYRYPADSGFTLTQQDSVWVVNGTAADSAQVVDYLNQLRTLNSSDFNDAFAAQGKQPDYTATLRRRSGGPVRIEAYAQDSSFVLRTDRRPEVFVNSDTTGLWSQVFVGKKALVGAGESE